MPPKSFEIAAETAARPPCPQLKPPHRLASSTVGLLNQEKSKI